MNEMLLMLPIEKSQSKLLAKNSLRSEGRLRVEIELNYTRRITDPSKPPNRKPNPTKTQYKAQNAADPNKLNLQTQV